MDLIEIEINGQKLRAEPGTMIIQAADNAGISIPRFCYHKKLSIAANCRMCLVEVSGARKPLPACATPVAKDMKVFTQSALAVDAQRSVMEFLLINHPLDCPICDQGGECELQDVSMGYGSDISRYNEGKRSVDDKNIGPLVKTDMTRCIHCTRCVRFGREIAGMPELGGVNRGEHMEITTYLDHNMQSELSGNIIDLCPVGALTNKPYRYTARAWELSQYPSIAPHDCLGSHLFAHTQQGKVKRVVAKDYESINETWLSDRDRYSCFGLYHEERLTQPQIKLDGVWQTVDWDTALNTAVEKLRAVIAQQGASQAGGLLSPSSTVEEAYLFQSILRGVGTHNIDHRLRQQDFSDDVYQPAWPGMTSNLAIADLSKVSAVLIIGTNLRKAQPLINLRLRQAALKGAKVYVINPVPFNKNFPLAGERIDADLVQELAGVAQSIAKKKSLSLPSQWSALVNDVQVSEFHQAIADVLIEQGNKAVLMLGNLSLHHPQASALRSLAAWIVENTDVQGCNLSDGANSAGAWLAGAVPHRLAAAQPDLQPGLNAQEMFKQSLAAYLLLGVEPELDSANSGLALQALQKAQCVIALTAYKNPQMLEYADVLLPISAFTETSGTFVNIEGTWQTFRGVAQPFGDSRPAWKVLRVLGNLLGLKSFDYVSPADVLEEVRSLCKDVKNVQADLAALKLEKTSAAKELMRVAETPIYSVDSLVRRSEPLQQTPDAQVRMIRIHPDLGAKLGVKEGEEIYAQQENARVCLPVKFDTEMPENVVWLPHAINETIGMGANFTAITLQKS